MSAADSACHELLLRLAGRLPGDVLWRLRDWLGTDTPQGRTAVGATLPKALLRNRIGLTELERALLVDAVGGWGAARRSVDAVLPVQTPDRLAFEFRTRAVDHDTATLSVLAVVRGSPGVHEVRQSIRVGAAGEQRVLILIGGDRPWQLTGTLQRVLRAHGDRVPAVEVLPTDLEPPTYHKAAIVGSAPLWTVTTAHAGALT